MATASQPKTGFGSLVRGALRFAGVDQGIDFTGKGQVLALGRGVVTRVTPHGSGWPGEGALVAYRLTSGARSGQTVYIAEDFQPAQGLHVGSVVKRGQVLGSATGSGKAPGIEIGWANPSGSPVAPLNPNPHGAKVEGYDFYGFATGSRVGALGTFIPSAQAATSQVTGQTFADKVLRLLGAPPSAQTLDERFIASWAVAEGTKAQFNPLASTLKEPGSTAFNAAGVQNYPSADIGAQATAQTLSHGYPNIVRFLRLGDPQSIFTAPGGVAELNKWATGRASTTETPYVQGISRGFYNYKGGASDWLSFDLTDAGSAVKRAVLAPFQWVERLISWIEGWAKRGLFVVGGFLLILLGIVIIGRQAASGTLKAAT